MKFVIDYYFNYWNVKRIRVSCHWWTLKFRSWNSGLQVKIKFDWSWICIRYTHNIHVIYIIICHLYIICVFFGCDLPQDRCKIRVHTIFSRIHLWNYTGFIIVCVCITRQPSSLFFVFISNSSIKITQKLVQLMWNLNTPTKIRTNPNANFIRWTQNLQNPFSCFQAFQSFQWSF